MKASITFGLGDRALRIAVYPLSWCLFVQGPSEGVLNIAAGPIRLTLNYGQPGFLLR